jgi:ankyrin repeat protein
LYAAENGDLAEVKRLLDKTVLADLIADINIRGLDNWTALHFAANEGRVNVIQELLSHPEIEKDPVSSINRTPLHLAAIRGNTAIVRALVAHKFNVNAKDMDENTPLHYASEFGHFETIIFLIKEADADLKVRNRYGYGPSDIA